MLIEKFVAPAAELTDIGLQAIEMNRLGRFVALTGKNGAGKSRILNKLFWYVPQYSQHKENLTNINKSIQQHKNIIQANPPEHQNQTGWKNALQNLLNQKAIATERIFSSIDSKLSVLHFVPKQLNLSDPRQHNKASLDGYFNNAKNPGLNGFETACFSYIQKVQDREWAASHQRATHEASVKQEANEEYEGLSSLIKLLLKTNLGRSIDSDATLFGKPLADAGLSDGQKVLIQFAVALHAQKKKLEDTIFLMDEPENHLHPSALIEFLDRLAEVAPNPQFWIATHSVPLLAYIAQKEPMSIWYVEDGRISNAGSKPEQVLRGLLGDDEQIGNLNLFTSLPAQYAAINFSAECLTAPKTVGAGTGDPQVRQINGLLDLDATTPISLLDYGAGKSRILSGLREIAIDQGRKLSDSVSYFAFDPSPDDKPDSLAVIESIYNGDTARHFVSKDDFFTSKNEKSIDVIVMCNVLHEIPPNDWLTTFNTHSLIARSLKDSGHLLIVEDQRIPIGEKAHKFGFLILDTPHLRTLFSVTEDDIKKGLFTCADHRGDGRLKAHTISEMLLSRLNQDTRYKAIVELRETAKEKIGELRGAKPNYRNGQLHGFWTQQFANAALFLEQ